MSKDKNTEANYGFATDGTRLPKHRITHYNYLLATKQIKAKEAREAREAENANSEAKNANSEAKNANSEAENANSEAKNANSEAKNANSEAENANSEAENANADALQDAPARELKLEFLKSLSFKKLKENADKLGKTELVKGLKKEELIDALLENVEIISSEPVFVIGEETETEESEKVKEESLPASEVPEETTKAIAAFEEFVDENKIDLTVVDEQEAFIEFAQSLEVENFDTLSKEDLFTAVTEKFK